MFTKNNYCVVFLLLLSLFGNGQNYIAKNKVIPSFRFSNANGYYVFENDAFRKTETINSSSSNEFICDYKSLPFDIANIVPSNQILGHAVYNEQTKSYAIISRGMFNQEYYLFVVDSLGKTIFIDWFKNKTHHYKPICWLSNSELIVEQFELDGANQHVGIYVYNLKTKSAKTLPINKNYLSTPRLSENKNYLIYGCSSNMPDKLHGNIDEIYVFNLNTNTEALVYKDSLFLQNISWLKNPQPTPKKKPLLLDLPWEFGITYCVTRDGNISPTGPVGSTSPCANLGPHSYIAWDFDTPNNSQEKIIAAESGVITLANYAPGSGGFSPSGYGNWVIITHSNNYRTLYAHLSAIFVSVGDTVEQGCLIGYEGTTGSSSGDHLHFEYEYPGGTSGNTYTNFKECNCIPHRAYNYTSSNSPGLCNGYSDVLICNNATPINCGQLYSNQTNSGGSLAISSYPCAPSTDETGPEKIYSITTTSTGNITATLSNTSYATGDVDVHILSACDENSCLARGDFSATYNNAPSGTYYIVVDGFQGDVGPYDILVNCNDISSFVEKSYYNDIKIFPNPTSGIINITPKENINYINVYSVSGSLVMSVNFKHNNKNQLNISKLKSGLYFIKVALENNIVLNYKINKL